MQPIYVIRQSPEFAADVVEIFGDPGVFDEAFVGFASQLARLPRGKGTWDLSKAGDVRLANLMEGHLPDGTPYPGIYFTFQLLLADPPYLLLLRAKRANDPRLS